MWTRIAILTFALIMSSAHAKEHENPGNGNGNGGGREVRGAPGPIAGAGLPILAIGYGVYWLVRRRKMQGRRGP
jgi:hypothetical protein